MRRTIFLAALLLMVCRESPAEPIVSVIKRGAVKSSIDISNFSAGGGTPAAFMGVLKADLEMSGWFTVVNQGRGAFAIDGSCEEGRELEVRCRVRNMATGEACLSRAFHRSAAEYRKLAHEVADAIVLAVKGCPGIASTRIVMVGTPSGSKEIFVCDYDGGGLAQVTHDKSICVAPAWTPAGNAVVYTSFRTAFPYVYMINLSSTPATRTRITEFPGLNVCAAVSPDGRKMALSLSKDGNPDLYVMNLGSRALARVTRTAKAAEASPSWSPDGRKLVYVSDSAGRPNLFITGADGSDERRISFTGYENVSPDWGRNGMIVFSSKRDGRYRICVMDPDTREETVLTTDDADYDDPSWAPDGRHVVCARTEGHRSNVYVIDTMGDSPICLTKSKSGDWYSPAWSPK